MKLSKHMTIKARRAVSGYLFILPFIIGFLMFMLQPLLDSFYMSLCDVTVSNTGFQRTFIGIANYVRTLTIDPEFNQMLVNEITKMATNSIAILVVSFVIAIILNQAFKGRAFVRAIFFLPVILSSGVLVGVESENTLLAGIQNLISESSPINITDSMMSMLRLSGMGGDVLEVVFELIASVNTIVMASGIQIVVFLSGLQTIPPSLYEAADVEGCTKWESFWKITFPMISPLLIVNIIYTIIDFFMKTDNEIMKKIHEEMVINLNYGFSAAMSWIYFGVTIAMISIATLIISRGVHSYE